MWLSRPTSFYSSSIAPLSRNITRFGSGLFQGNRLGHPDSGLRKVGAMQAYAVFGLLKLVSTGSVVEAQEAGPFADGVYVVVLPGDTLRN